MSIDSVFRALTLTWFVARSRQTESQGIMQPSPAVKIMLTIIQGDDT